MFDYVTRGLKYSEGATYRRIQSMRLMKEVSAVEDKISSGEIDLTRAAKLNSFFRQKAQNHAGLSDADKLQVIEEAVGKSTRELEKDLRKKSSTPPEVNQKRRRPRRFVRRRRFLRRRKLFRLRTFSIFKPPLAAIDLDHPLHRCKKSTVAAGAAIDFTR